MDEITELQASTLKALAHPIRLQLLHLLATEPTPVTRLAAALGVSQPNVSQHLAVLRSTGLVEVDREGREASYRLTDGEILVACSLMRGVLERRLSRLARLAQETPVPKGTVPWTSH